MNTAQAKGSVVRTAPALALVADDLARVEGVIADTLAPYRDRFGALVDHLRHYRGKRLRPALLMLAARACGEVTHAHHVLAAGVELVHSATLVHDDVLDEADLRRHAPTVNAGWGNKVSILLGDLLFTSAFHLTARLGDARACAWIGEATDRVCAGELRQLTEAGNLALSRDDYFAIIEGKTAALTECACRLGAVYAGAHDDVVAGLAAYGRDLGMAFQVADDMLDLVGDERKTGKTLGTDLKQQKLTLPLIYLFETLPEADSLRLQRSLREGDPVGPADVRAALASTDAVGRAGAFAKELAARARRSLGCLEGSPFREALRQLADWAVRREQ